MCVCVNKAYVWSDLFKIIGCNSGDQGLHDSTIWFGYQIESRIDCISLTMMNFKERLGSQLLTTIDKFRFNWKFYD